MSEFIGEIEVDWSTNSSLFSIMSSETTTAWSHSMVPFSDPEIKRYVKVEELALKSVKFDAPSSTKESSILMSYSNWTSETSSKHIVATPSISLILRVEFSSLMEKLATATNNK